MSFDPHPEGGNGRSQASVLSLPPVGEQDTDLLHPPKSIVVSTEVGRHVDNKVVALKYYNAFNYSLVVTDPKASGSILGVTSPNPREGKTLISCNLAASLALGSRRKTVIVDLNTRRPRVHDIFGVSGRPGLAEALGDGDVHVSRTKFDRLSVLAAGNPKRPRIDLGDLPAFEHVLRSLRQEFDFVIIDMSPLSSGDFPLTFTNTFSGVLVVIDVRRTRRRHIDKVFRQLPYDNVLGFVFNRVTDDNF
jgi:Mrp family chromosome partitioning ATPase